MSSDRVLVHSCFGATTPEVIYPGTERTFHRFVNARCSCRHHISFDDRDARVKAGEAFVVLRVNSNGHTVPIWREIILANKQVGPPWCEPLRGSTIEAAIAGKSRAVEHVAFYGLTAQNAGMYAWREDVQAAVEKRRLEDLARIESVDKFAPAKLRPRTSIFPKEVWA